MHGKSLKLLEFCL